MTKKTLVVVMSLFLAVGFTLLVRNMEVDYVPDVVAATDTSAVSVACTDPTQTGFAADATATVSWSAPAAPSAATTSASLALTGPLHSEANPTVTSTLNATGITSGRTLLVYQTPEAKLSGLQCQPSTDNLKYEAHGDGVDAGSIDIAVSNIADSDTAYTAADKVDNAAATAKDVLFGTSGQISVSTVNDGTDKGTTNDGEIRAGGATESEGASQTEINLDALNRDVNTTSDVETLTMTLTAS